MDSLFHKLERKFRRSSEDPPSPLGSCAIQEAGFVGAEQSTFISGVRIIPRSGEGVTLVELVILAGERLPILSDLWTETQGDRRLGVNEKDFIELRYGGYGVSGGGAVWWDRWSTSSFAKAELEIYGDGTFF